MLCLTITVMAQSNSKISFKENPPNQPPAIFAATMPPCIIGVAHQYGKSLGISKATLHKAKGIIKEAHQKVPEFKSKVRILEIALMNASKEGRYKDYKRLLKKLSKVKIEASLFHESLVEKARKTFAKTDVKKIDQFIEKNMEIFLAANKLK